MSWKVDSAHTQVQFSVKHMMISKVKGVFEELSGEINFDENKPEKSTVNIAIQMDSINTREPQRNNHLKSPDFFNTSEFPIATFKSTSVVVTNEKKGVLNGNLTIKNITKPVSLQVEFNGLSKSPYGSVSAGFTAVGKINRKDWGLTWNQALETGGVLVGDEIDISVDVELIQYNN